MNIFSDSLIKPYVNLRVIILLVLLLSLLMPSSIVFADDTNPPVQGDSQTEPVLEGEVDGPASQPQSGDIANQETVPEESVTDELKQAEDPLPVAAEAATGPETVVEEVPDQVISQLPEGTDLVVVDQQGEIEPLATAEAQEALVESDPIWCPEGATPQALANGCTDSYSNLTDLLTSLEGDKQPSQNGIIWIEKNYDSAAAEPKGTKGIIIDGDSYKTWRDYSLTVQGGWNGQGTSSIDLNTPSIFTGDYLSIINWKADVTVNDVVIDGAGGSAGLTVTTTGDVSIERVESKNNKNNRGAYLDNDAGTGKVAVREGRFTGNGNGTDDDGLYISSKGEVTLIDILASGNKDDGVEVINTASKTNASVTVAGTNVFSGNTSDGLYIRSKGAIMLSNITSDGSKKDSGVVLDNDEAGASGGITISGDNSFSGNNDWGLQVYSRGDLVFENVVADGNKTQDGAYLDNDAGTGDVTLTGVTSFSGNGNGSGDDGLYITSKGNVSLVDLIASGNRDEGVEIQNTASPTSAGVVVSGVNVFTGNKGDGLLVRSKGGVLLANLTSQGNGGDGVNVTNHTSTTNGAVTITGVNSFSENTSDGLYIRSKGAIMLSNVTADENVNDSGARLDNDEAGASGGITISGDNSFSGNNDWGLQVYSRGDLVFENVVADGNKTQDGAYLDNDAGTGNVTLTGVTSFSGNGNGSGDDGLYITSKGNIVLNEVAAYASPNHLTAEGNKGSGVRLDNDGGTGDILIGGFGNSISNNAYDGLWVSTKGNVDIYHLTASGNKAEGVELITATTAPNDANIYCSIFGNNGTYGVLGRYARGSLTFQGETVFSGNKKGDYYYQTANGLAAFNPDYDCNLPAPPALPVNEGERRATGTAGTLLIPVTGGQLLPISCEYSSTTLVLTENERVTFMNLCGYEALLQVVPEAEYPEALLELGEFEVGLTVVLLEGGEPVMDLPDGSAITLSFSVPEAWQTGSFSIVFWDTDAHDGTGGWVAQAVQVESGLAEITVDFTGTFFLVTQ